MRVHPVLANPMSSRWAQFLSRSGLLSFSVLLIGLALYFVLIGKELNQEKITESSYVLKVVFALYILLVLGRKIIKEPSQVSILKGALKAFVGLSIAGALWAIVMFALFYNIWLKLN